VAIVTEVETRFRIVDLAEGEQRDCLRVLYEACPSGREFELFLKLVISAMGLEDVSVTRYSRDKGIDLTARRSGVIGNRFDEVRYVVQAKRLAPDRTVPIESVRALRGVLTHLSRGMFITTGRFSDDAEKFAVEDPSRPIVLVDGLALISTCIQHGVGFRFRPVLEREWVLGQLEQLPAARDQPAAPAEGRRSFLKTITANDIRARIISLPWEMDELLPPSAQALRIEFPPHVPAKDYAYRRDRRYVAGVTDVLRRLGLLGPNGEHRPRLAEWSIAPGAALLSVRLADAASVA
jgi:restriction system protein